MKYLFYSLVICLLSIGCNSEENRSKEKQQQREALLDKIEAFRAIDDWESSLKTCSELINLDSTLAENYQMRSAIYEKLFDLDTNNKKLRELAYNDLSKAILISPDHKSYINRGLMSRDLFENKNSALDDFNRAYDKAKTNLDKADVLHWRSNLYFNQMKDSTNAFRDIETALSILPKNDNSQAKFRYKEYHFLMKLRNFQLAEEKIHRMRDKKEWYEYDQEEINKSLLYCKIEQGNYLGALTILESINLPLKFKNHHKGYCLFKTGKVSEGKKLMMEYKNPFPGPPYKGKKFNTSKYFIEVFPEYKTDTHVATPSWDWPNDTQVED